MFDSLTGMAACDRFFRALSGICGRPAPARFARERRALVDGMRDAASAFGGKRVVLAGETDAVVGLSALVREMGGDVPLAVVPTHAPACADIASARVIVGDFGSVKGDFDLLIAGSHGAMAAEAAGAGHLVWGFPVFERLGYNSSVSVLYRGTLNMVNLIGNALMEGGHEGRFRNH